METSQKSSENSLVLSDDTKREIEIFISDKIEEKFQEIEGSVHSVQKICAALMDIFNENDDGDEELIRIDKFNGIGSADLENEEALTAVRGSYDELFYEQRQNMANMKFFEKSESTIKLNQRPLRQAITPEDSLQSSQLFVEDRQGGMPRFLKIKK
jgi:hypothetical protein